LHPDRLQEMLREEKRLLQQDTESSSESSSIADLAEAAEVNSFTLTAFCPLVLLPRYSATLNGFRSESQTGVRRSEHSRAKGARQQIEAGVNWA